MAPLLYDAHNHLQDEWLEPHRDRVFDDLEAIGVRAAVVNGTCEADWPRVAALCREHSSVSAAGKSPSATQPIQRTQLLPSYGLHPWHVGNRSADWLSTLRAQLTADPTAAIGEIGLDRWILDRARPDDLRLTGLRRAPVEEQLDVFAAQLALAVESDRPVTIHCIDAHGALFDALRNSRRPQRGFLLHAYAGSLEMMKSFAELGAYFSFNGYFLDPRRAARLQPVYRAIPSDRLLVETDAPAMPLPIEHQRFSLPHEPGGATVGHPANLVVAYEELARWRDTELETFAGQVAENFSRFFGPLSSNEPKRAVGRD